MPWTYVMIATGAATFVGALLVRSRSKTIPKAPTTAKRKRHRINVGYAKAQPQELYVTVLPVSHIVPGTAVRVTTDTHPSWPHAPVALYGFPTTSSSSSPKLQLHAIGDACPHVAIGSLSKGDVCVLSDLEDLSVVSCPVHTYVFDLKTGHCLTDKRNHTPATPVYKTRIACGADGLGMVQICTTPNASVPNKVPLDVGNAAQLALVKIGLDRKFGGSK